MIRALAVAVCMLAMAGCGGAAGKRLATSASSTARPAPHPPPARAQRRHPPFAVGLRVMTFVDATRTIQPPGAARQPRRLVTLVRYPAQGTPSRVDAPGAPAAQAAGPFPLVIFGHGFGVTPGPYAAMLEAWARAGYVVAAPIFPLENANAPGGPNEADLVNQPRDMSFVITSLLGSRGPFEGLIDPRRIAASGQSDGGETALAVAYDDQFLDRRVRAAMILSGAKIPGVGGFNFPAPSPPLLATQGTADTVNPPSFTHAFFDIAPSPKYLLTMPGASHLGPYTDQQPQLGIVERVTVAFLNRYLRNEPGALDQMLVAGDVRGKSVIRAYP